VASSRHEGHAAAKVCQVEEHTMNVDGGLTGTPVASASAEDAMDVDASSDISTPDKDAIELSDSDDIEMPECV
jgi:hypothetical protein